jgi:hypothetical protein
MQPSPSVGAFFRHATRRTLIQLALGDEQREFDVVVCAADAPAADAPTPLPGGAATDVPRPTLAQARKLQEEARVARKHMHVAAAAAKDAQRVLQHVQRRAAAGVASKAAAAATAAAGPVQVREALPHTCVSRSLLTHNTCLAAAPPRGCTDGRGACA